MFWKYVLFEGKLLVYNRKHWLIAVFLLFFFLVFFIYYSQEEPQTLKEQKEEEAENTYAGFFYLDYSREDVPEVAEVYDIYTEVASLTNLQVYYLGIGDDSEEYIASGLEANDLRLQIHDLNNEGIPDHLVKPTDEILKENALLQYVQNHKLPIKTDSFTTNHYFTNAFFMMSGLFLLIILLICGNELLVYETRHQSVVQGFPLSFMKKVHGKTAIHFIFLYVLLLSGFFLGTIYASTKLNAADFSFPILIYMDGSYVAVSTATYLVYMLLGFSLVIILLLYVSLLLNMLFKNAFTNVLIGLGIFALPDLIAVAGIQTNLFLPIKYIDIARVLSGDLAVDFGANHVDYWHVIFSLIGLILLTVLIIYVVYRVSFNRTPKDMPLERVF